MNHELEVELLERLLHHVEADSRDLAPAMVQRPVADYTSIERFEAERDALFRAHPVVVGHTAQLAEPGRFFTHDHSGVPIVVTRTEAPGTIKAFINVCRHRGGTVVGEACGTARRLTCAYHGWSYDLDGALRGLPLRDGFDQLDTERYGLVELPVAVRHGFIFVRPQPGPAIDLDGVLGGLSDDLEDQEPETELLALRSWDIGANWKIVLDNFLELYHLPTLHAANIGPLFEPNRILADAFWPSSRRIDARRSVRKLPGTPTDSWRLRDHALATYFLFPNTQTFWTQDYYSWFSIWPQSVDRTVCTQHIVADWAADDDQRRAHLQTNLDLFDLTLGEDFVISEQLQANLTSGANDHVTFGRHEQGAANVHLAIDEALGRVGRGEPVDAWRGRLG